MFDSPLGGYSSIGFMLGKSRTLASKQEADREQHSILLCGLQDGILSSDVSALRHAIGELPMLRAFSIVAVIFWLNVAHAQTFTEREAANGIRYSIPDNWTPITMNQVVRYGTQVPDYIGRLEQEVPGAQRLHSESSHIFFLNWLAPDKSQIAMLSLITGPVERDERIAQWELKSASEAELNDLITLLRQQGPETASATLRAGGDIYNAVRFRDAYVQDFGKWSCITQLLEVDGKNGSRPYFLPINCPAGSIYLQFNLFVEKDRLTEAMEVVSQIISSVDVSAITSDGP